MYSEYSDFSNISPEGNFCDYEKLKRFFIRGEKKRNFQERISVKVKPVGNTDMDIKHTADMFFVEKKKNYLFWGISIGAGSLCFSALVILGVLYISTLMSQQITTASTQMVEQFITTSNSNGASAPSEKTDGFSKGAETGTEKLLSFYDVKSQTDGDELLKLFGAARMKDLQEFDAIAQKIIAENGVLEIKTLFTKSGPGTIEDIARCYKVWRYIVQTRKAKPIDAGVALLEAASAVIYSDEYKVPLALAIGVMQTESNFRTDAVSGAGACGPMQVMWNIHSGLLSKIGITKKDDLFTANKGVKAGCFLLARYAKDEHNVVGGLKRYYGALSAKYINLVLTHKHAYELFESKMIKDTATAINKEQINWSKIDAPKKPILKASSATAKQKTTISAAPAKNAAKPAAGTSIVYRNTGSIIMKKPDGQIIKWKE